MMEIPKNFSLFRDDLEYMLNASLRDWKFLRGCHLFLTGCTSFFGKWLLEAMLWADRELTLDLRITVLSRHVGHFLDSVPHLRSHKILRFVEGNVLDFPQQQVEPFQYAIHAVNLPYNATSTHWAMEHMLTAIQGAERVWTLAKACNCRSLLLASSGAVYGVQFVQKSPLQESGLPVSLTESNVYGNTKRFLEIYVRALAEGSDMNVPIARCFSFTGAHMPLVRRSALGSFIADVLQDRPIVISGDGTPIRSFLYGRDLVVWLLAVLVRGENNTFNIGSSYATSLKELASLVLRSAGRSINDLKIMGHSIEGNAPNCYVPNVSYTIDKLNVQESFTLEQSINKTLDWHTTNPIDYKILMSNTLYVH